MMRFFTLVISAIALLGAPNSAAGQDTDTGFAEHGPRFLLAARPNPVRIDAARIPVLRQRIALDLREVGLYDALEAITRQSGLRLMYSDKVLPEERNVTLRAEEITVAAALTEVLLDAGVDILFSSSGNAALIRRGAVARAATGIVTGRVTDSTTGDGIVGAMVMVEGTRLSTTTSPEGRYTIGRVPAGAQRITARRLGYVNQVRSLAVPENGTVTANFALVRAPTVLTEVVATATGDRRRLEVGNAIGTIRADSIVPTTLIRNLSDLLQARTPGVVVSNTVGQVGAPSRIRLRGVNSMTLNNDPVIIVDGIRLQSQVTNSGTAGQTNTGDPRITAPGSLNFTNRRLDDLATSRLDDIDPNMIESIDVLKGPSATSLYGTEASNGVIVIRTKRAVVGPFRVRVLADRGWSHNIGEQPTIWAGWGRLPEGSVTAGCALSNTHSVSISQNVVDGTCIQDSVVAYTPSNDPDLTTIGIGSARNLSLSISGGTDRLRQFFSVRGSDNVGLLKMSNAESRRLARMWGTEPPRWMRRPNTEKSVNAASRTDLQPTPNLEMGVSVNGTYRDVMSGHPSIASQFGTTAGFYRVFDTLSYLPSELQRTRQQQIVKRGVATGNVMYRPRPWLALRGTIGGDYTLRNDELQERVQDCTLALNPAGCPGARGVAHDEILVKTADFGGTITLAPSPWLTTRTSFGEQYTHINYNRLASGNALGTQLAFGSELLTPAPVATIPGRQLYSVVEARDESATAGWYLEQTAGLRDRVFIIAGLRQDASSAFGEEVNNKAPIYPKYTLSWLASDEPFFPSGVAISSFRLRSAYGHSGKQAGQAAVLKNFAQGNALAADGTPFGAVLVPGIRLTAIGNPNLKPERTTEFEGGFDASFFGSERVTLSATMYRKLSRDAIVQVALPSSYGLQFLTQYVNVGSVENRGTELTINARLADSRAFSWDVTANMTVNRNELVKMSPAATAGVSSGFKVGYPIFGLFFNQILSYHDLNGDGILALSEVVFSDTAVYRGAPYPRRENNYHSSIGLLNGALRIGAAFNHVVGLSTSTTNNLGSGSVNSNNRCQFDRTCTLAEQAMSMQARQSGSVEQSTTLRFSELSLTYNLPDRIAHGATRARSASVSLAGRNLYYWTSYYGKDPNVSMGAITGESARDFGNGLAQPRNWTLRLNLGF